MLTEGKHTLILNPKIANAEELKDNSLFKNNKVIINFWIKSKITAFDINFKTNGKFLYGGKSNIGNTKDKHMFQVSPRSQNENYELEIMQNDPFINYDDSYFIMGTIDIHYPNANNFRTFPTNSNKKLQPVTVFSESGYYKIHLVDKYGNVNEFFICIGTGNINFENYVSFDFNSVADEYNKIIKLFKINMENKGIVNLPLAAQQEVMGEIKTYQAKINKAIFDYIIDKNNLADEDDSINHHDKININDWESSYSLILKPINYEQLTQKIDIDNFIDKNIIDNIISIDSCCTVCWLCKR